MPGVNIGWDNTVPAGSESASLGDDRIRSMKTSVQQAFDAEHVFSASGGAGTGAHRPGSAMAAVGTQSLVSSGDTEGRLFYASDTSRLFGTPSTGTVYIGGPTVISAGTFPGSLPQRHHWVEEFGQGDTVNVGGSVTSVQITIPNSGYSGLPYVWANWWQAGASGVSRVFIRVERATATTFDVVGEPSIAGQRFAWRSLGTRVL